MNVSFGTNKKMGKTIHRFGKFGLIEWHLFEIFFFSNRTTFLSGYRDSRYLSYSCGYFNKKIIRLLSNINDYDNSFIASCVSCAWATAGTLLSQSAVLYLFSKLFHTFAGVICLPSSRTSMHACVCVCWYLYVCSWQPVALGAIANRTQTAQMNFHEINVTLWNLMTELIRWSGSGINNNK